tara:strand:+ start:2155 stop:2685 length:531 start_codon:yes stop_codon:yes gene_type:complete
MRILKLLRFDLATAMFLTALIAWTFACERVLGIPGVLLGHLFLLLISVGCFVAIAAVRRYFLPRFWSYRFPLYMAGFGFLPILYLASMGPAIWLCATYYNADTQSTAVLNTYNAAYGPAATCIVDFPHESIHDLGISYLRWWMPDRTVLYHRGRSLGLDSVLKSNPNRGLSYRFPI